MLTYLVGLIAQKQPFISERLVIAGAIAEFQRQSRNKRVANHDTTQWEGAYVSHNHADNHPDKGRRLARFIPKPHPLFQGETTRVDAVRVQSGGLTPKDIFAVLKK